MLFGLAEITGSELMQWINTSFMAVAIVLFALGYIASMKVVRDEMLSPLRAENALLRELLKQALETSERHAELIGQMLEERAKGGDNR
ncbi:MAG TPA: hypothetical protein VD969_19505 [Symbiobacteriaceae bacterium]|nr:hypothetical protein [Symbiobacteriaceae bacterium]